FTVRVDELRLSAAGAVDERGGRSGARLQRQVPPDVLRAVMERFAGEPQTRWGLANALTAEARWAPTFAEATWLEGLRGVGACPVDLAHDVHEEEALRRVRAIEQREAARAARESAEAQQAQAAQKKVSAA